MAWNPLKQDSKPRTRTPPPLLPHNLRPREEGAAREAPSVNGWVSRAAVGVWAGGGGGGVGPQDRDESNSTRQSANLPGATDISSSGRVSSRQASGSPRLRPERERGLGSDLFGWQGPEGLLRLDGFE